MRGFKPLETITEIEGLVEIELFFIHTIFVPIKVSSGKAITHEILRHEFKGIYEYARNYVQMKLSYTQKTVHTSSVASGIPNYFLFLK